MKVKEIALDKIKVSESRQREDLGDLTELQASLDEKGLIQPISIDGDFNLLAGERRYTSAKNLGWAKISCVIHDITDEISAQEIELYENIHRKELTWQERVQAKKRIHDLMIAEHGS